MNVLLKGGMSVPVKSLYLGLDWPLIGDLDGRGECEKSHLVRERGRREDQIR